MASGSATWNNTVDKVGESKKLSPQNLRTFDVLRVQRATSVNCATFLWPTLELRMWFSEGLCPKWHCTSKFPGRYYVSHYFQNSGMAKILPSRNYSEDSIFWRESRRCRYEYPSSLYGAAAPQAKISHRGQRNPSHALKCSNLLPSISWHPSWEMPLASIF